MAARKILVVGGSSGIGLELAKDLTASGDEVVLTSRSAESAEQVAASLGGNAQGVALDVSEPEGIAEQLKGVGKLNGIVLGAIERDANTVENSTLPVRGVS